MPFKHQMNCYRTINGAKYFNQCDVLDEPHFALVENAKELKIRHRVIKHIDGFGQLFVHTDDVDKLYNSELTGRGPEDEQ